MTMGEEKKEEDRLQNEWVLWKHESPGGGSKNPNQWKDSMKELCEIRTIQEFWRFWNHIPTPSQVFFDGECRKRVGPDQKTIEEFSLFKKGIEPEWGDPQNVTGGEWFCRYYFEPDVLDLYWQNLAMALLGETIEDAVDENKTYNKDIINGCRVVDKSRAFPMFKLEVWIASRDEKVRERVKEKLLEIITDGHNPARTNTLKFEWKDHSP